MVKTAQPRNYSSSLVTAQEKHLTQLAAFSPAIAHWELSERDASLPLEASSWELRVALLFVDISGFTNLCTRLDIDCLQRHINTYFTQLIDIVVARGGDVLRFAGDAIFCSWSLAPHADDEDLALATAAVCTPRPPRPPGLCHQRALAPAALPRTSRAASHQACAGCLGDCQHAHACCSPPHPDPPAPTPPPPTTAHRLPRRARARSSSIGSAQSTRSPRSRRSSRYTRAWARGR